MYFLEKRTVFFEPPDSGIFRCPPKTIGLQMCLPPPPDIALYAPQAGSLSTASFKSHFTATALGVGLLSFQGTNTETFSNPVSPPLSLTV
jgi:hypothetical protein